MRSTAPSNFVIPCQSVVRPQNPNKAPRDFRIAARRASRVYLNGFEVVKPQLVTGTNTPVDRIERGSRIYRPSESQSYFVQCFRVCRRLGKGVFGEADEVESLEDGKRYAIKRALRTFEGAASRRIKIREALVHEAVPPLENTLRFAKAWEERGRLYIETKLCRGNLAEYRRQFGILPENELYLVFFACSRPFIIYALST